MAKTINKTAYIGFKLHESDKRMIEQEARRRGLKPSEFLRSLWWIYKETRINGKER